jgi:hypothetical protein
MTIDPSWIMLQLVVGGAGFILFTYGRRQERMPHLLAGLLLMVLPFVATASTSLLLASAAVAVVTWWAVRLGW